jgi:hypothetical protein
VGLFIHIVCVFKELQTFALKSRAKPCPNLTISNWL